MEALATGKGKRSPPVPVATPLSGSGRTGAARGSLPPGAADFSICQEPSKKRPLASSTLSHQKRENLAGLESEVPETQLQVENPFARLSDGCDRLSPSRAALLS